MLTKKRFSIRDLTLWTRWETLIFIGYAFLIVFLFDVLNLTFIQVPWLPVALVGTALAFILGFQNNAAYDRIWEARKIWGGIVNNSRTWGMKVNDMVTNEYATQNASDAELSEFKRKLFYRHFAWLTALRHAMRQRKPWEVAGDEYTNKEWARKLYLPEREESLKTVLECYLSKDELNVVLTKKNVPAALLYLQSKQLRDLKERGYVWEFSFLELENLLEQFFTLQGQSERIKNFPYPRQYASLSYYFVWIFIILLPFGVVQEFSAIGAKFAGTYPVVSNYFVWLAVPFCVVVSWIFHTMERIGRAGENPFEGSVNDVPISTITRGIEIDLRQLLNEDPDSIPPQFPEKNHIQM